MRKQHEARPVYGSGNYDLRSVIKSITYENYHNAASGVTVGRPSIFHAEDAHLLWKSPVLRCVRFFLRIVANLSHQKDIRDINMGLGTEHRGFRDIFLLLVRG
jgi:hypothetical protein